MPTSESVTLHPSLPVRSRASGAQRIDESHSNKSAVQPDISPLPVSDGPAYKSSDRAAVAASETPEEMTGEELLRLHAESLIRELRDWADKLEAQNAELNVRSAMQDQRETQFRLWESSQRQQLGELSLAAEKRYADAKEAFMRAAITEFGNLAR